MHFLSWPNCLTVARIILIAPFVLSLIRTNQYPQLRYVALVIFVIMALSDLLDGMIARRRGQVTRLGSFLDPMADKLMITCAVILLGHPATAIEGRSLPPWVVVSIIGKDIIVVLGVVVIHLMTQRVLIAPSPSGKIATALQAAMVFLLLLSPDLPESVKLTLPRIAWIAAGIWAVIAAADYIRRGSNALSEYEARKD